PDGNVLIISDNKPFLTKINPDGQILYQSSTESNINGISASDTLGGPAAAGTLAGIQTIAEIIILESIPTVYYRKYVYYKYIIGTDPPLPRAEKCYTYFYRDSERTDLIGSTVDEYYVPGRS
ncbi:MAG TPA: hypothetical protein GXX35_15445, partial [Thermoanaerobacterales bacterium]|nr:hypothetical protein [Thermoanaerobacterales bacterium]